MSGEYEIEWQVDDGYAGGRRPQNTDIDTEYMDDSLSIQEIEEEITRQVIEDFKDKINIDFDCGARNELAKKIKENLCGSGD